MDDSNLKAQITNATSDDRGQVNSAQQDITQASTQQVQQPADAGSATTTQQPQPTADESLPQVSVSSGKESAPIVVTPKTEVMEEIAPEVQVPQEVQEAGVEATKGEVLHVPADIAQAGVQPTGTAAPIPEEPTIQLPITEEKAKSILKIHKKVKDSVTWLAMMVVRQLQIMRFQQKKTEKKK